MARRRASSRWPSPDALGQQVPHRRQFAGQVGQLAQVGVAFAGAVEIAAAPPDVFWVTQDDGYGAIARLTYYAITSSAQITSVALPTPGLRPTGIAVALDNGVWVAAYMPARVYLPLVFKNS